MAAPAVPGAMTRPKKAGAAQLGATITGTHTLFATLTRQYPRTKLC